MSIKFWQTTFYISFACLPICQFVCLYPINVKTAELIRPKFCVGPQETPGKVYEWSKFQKFMFKSFYFVKFWKCTKKYYELRNLLFVFALYKEKMLTDKATIKSKNKDGREAP